MKKHYSQIEAKTLSDVEKEYLYVIAGLEKIADGKVKRIAIM